MCSYPLEKSGSARVFGYTVYRGFLNRVYGILQLKYGYSVYHFLWISVIKYILGIFGWILVIFGYFGEFSSGILVYHYPPMADPEKWPVQENQLAEKVTKIYQLKFLKNKSIIHHPSSIIHHPSSRVCQAK